MSAHTRILVVDNYDSFVYNLVQYVAELGADPVVVRNDESGTDDAAAAALIERHRPIGVLVSPGPGTPSEAGISNAVVRACRDRAIPLFGVCLGHQCIGEVYGGAVVHAPELLHGKTSLVEHDDSGVLAGLPSPFQATRYHSLAVDEADLSPEILITGRTSDGVVMGLRHATLPIDGVQFHPESVLTEHGYRIVANWLSSLGLTTAPALADALDGTLGSVRAGAHFVMS